MVREKVVVKNKSGIHARPAGELAAVAKRCNSDVIILTGNKIVNPKSILNLMAATIHKGTEVTVQCSGDTEKEDLNLLIDAINSGLGEDE